MVKKIIVLGGGSAGFLAAITLRTKMRDLPVVVIRSREIGIIGVGEGTTFAFPSYCHGTLRIDPGEFLRSANPAWKLGLKFLKWGPRDHFMYSFSSQLNAKWNDLPKAVGFYCDEEFSYANPAAGLMEEDRVFMRTKEGAPMIGHDFGYHLENVTFVEYLEAYAQRLGIQIVEDTVEAVHQDDQGVTGLLLKSGRTERADLYVDCSGFVSLLLSKTLHEPFISFKSTLYCDKAVVGGWERTDEVIKPYTTVEGMDCGWCWQIEHEHRINRGYVYSSGFISDDQAEREFRERNPKITKTRVVDFVAGRYERAWVKNVVAIGNACGFVEPLEATSLGVICDEAYWLAETLIDCDREVRPTLLKVYNHRAARKWDCIRQFLGIHYKFNTAFETDFWRECREKVDLAGSEEIVEYYRENGPSILWRQSLIDPHDQFASEGYLALLVGQRVPYRKTYTIPRREKELWTQIRDYIQKQARNGYSVKEAIQLLKSPNWRWHPDFYKKQATPVT